MRWFVVFLFLPFTLAAQMWDGRDTLYGNEWIRPGQSYYKIPVSADGVYRLSYETMAAAGIPVNEIAGGRYQLFHLGQETPLYVSSGEQPLKAGQYLEFYGQKNRSELDRYLFADPDREMLNPYYSLASDISVYFLTWAPAGQATLRFRDIPNDLSGTLPPKETWFMSTLVQEFNSTFLDKRYDSRGVLTLSSYEVGEGFGGASVREQTLNLLPESGFTGGPDGRLALRISAGIGARHLSIAINGQEVYNDTTVEAYQFLMLEFPIPAAALDRNIAVTIKGLKDDADRYTVGTAELRYPRRYAYTNARQALLNLPLSTARRYIEVSGFSAGGQAPVVYDLANQTRQSAAFDANQARWALPPMALDPKLVLFAAASVTAVKTIAPVSWLAPEVEQARYLIVSHPAFIGNGSSGPVAEYAAYRRSPEGGSYATAVVNIQQLYDQFAYGVPEHPLALKNLVNYLHRKGAPLEQLLLIGKGLSYALARKGATNHFLPTWGTPGSDNLMLSSGFSVEPIYPYGRIAATAAEQVAHYLAKVKAHEAGLRLPRTFDNYAWRKRVLHIVGGALNEQQLFKFYLDDIGQEIVDNAFGAQLVTQEKTSSAAVVSSPTEAVIEAVNAGVAIKTFLGHGNVTYTDFGLDDPDFFDNRHHFLAFSLGCQTGNLFSREFSVSERFLLAADKGAIGYIATSGYAYPISLFLFAKEFYHLAGTTMTGKGVGAIAKAVRSSFDAGDNVVLRSLMEQMSYHGDPAIVIFPYDRPDYVLDYRSVRLDPATISAQTDSIGLQFTIGNIGAVQSDTITLWIEHQLPEGKIFRDTFLVPTPTSFTPVSLRIPLRGDKPEGQNRLFIRLDPDNRVAEAPAPEAETNNDLSANDGSKGLPFFIYDNEPRPLFPSDFGIGVGDTLTLRAYTTNIFAPSRAYVCELDTTALFNSPRKLSSRLTADGGIIAWKPAVAWQDSTVYYWRISPDTTGTPGSQYSWRNSSFLYLRNGSPGWNQSHYFQLAANTGEALEWNANTGQLQYTPKPVGIIVESNIFSSLNNNYTRILRDNILAARILIGPTLGVAIFNPTFGTFDKLLTFRLDTLERRRQAIQYLRDSIPANQYVAVVTARVSSTGYSPDRWDQDSLLFGANLYSVLEAEGAQLPRLIRTYNSPPYAFAYQKGHGAVAESIGQPGEVQTRIFFELPALNEQGSLETGPIGPALSWSSLSWSYTRLENPSADSARVTVFGLATPSGQETPLLEQRATAPLSLSSIDARQYPYLKLRLITADKSKRTPPQLGFWRVGYQPVPEIALDPESFYRDSIQEGDSLRLRLRVHNLSNVALDSVRLRYRFTGPDNAGIEAPGATTALGPMGNASLQLSYNTFPLSEGANRLLVEASAAGLPPDPTPVNQSGERPFYVLGDHYPPLLDVTFDGNHILDGDLISPRPSVRITLRDDNRFLALSDTALLDISLRYPDGTRRTLRPGADGLVFTPATSATANLAAVEFQPALVQDGLYQLSVRGRDVSGNAAGALSYTVNFKIVNRSSIAHILPYPNPFSTSTRFLYTLTGLKEPDFFLVRILTPAGRVVREVTQAEFGPLRVGTHLSDFTWDGTDQYGDRLANGVYLYQVIVKDDTGADWETYQTGADRFFKAGFGKIVLMR